MLGWTATDDIATNLLCNVTLNGSVVQTNVASTSGSPTTTYASVSNGGYSWNVSCADPSGNVNTSETRTFTINTALPLIIGTGITPYAVLNGSPAGLYIRAVNAQAVWAVLGRPDGTNQTIALTNDSWTPYPSADLPGRYNVTFYASNSIGSIARDDDYFDVFPGVLVDLKVVNSNLTGINSTFIARYRNVTTAINSSAVGEYPIFIVNTVLDLEFHAHNDRAIVTTWGINISDAHNKQVGIDRHNQTAGYLVTYGIQPEWTVTNATLRIYYDDVNYTDVSNLRFDKCDNYTFTTRTCLGGWRDITNLSVVSVRRCPSTVGRAVARAWSWTPAPASSDATTIRRCDWRNEWRCAPVRRADTPRR
jgi:hypothetical protein